ncbi:MAG: phage integrase SAM-like domain-containing protein [Bacteroidota bacterium]
MATVQLRVSTKIDKNIGKGEILLRFFHGKIDIRSKTGIYVNPERWNKEKECLIIPRYATPEQIELTKLQSRIDELSNIISNAFVSTDRADISNKWLETLIDKFNNPQKYSPSKVEEIQEKTLLSYIEDFIIQSSERRNKETGRLLTPNNLQQYKATQKHLIAFAEISNRMDFQFNEINKQFYDNFVIYLQNPIQKTENGKLVLDKNGQPILIKKGFTLNSVGKHIKILKVMLNDAPKDLLAKSDHRGFHVFTEDIDNVYLNEIELGKLNDCDFSKTINLERVRDWFLLLAWTGCRFSDLTKINNSDKRNNTITFRQQKTGNKITIPLHPVVLEILQKYNYNIPEPVSNQIFNENIKEVAKKAGITEMENITRTVAGKLTTERLPKCDLITSHTGRRSFATNMYKRKIPSLTIMSITGHKTEKSFLKYIKVKQTEHAELMAAEWKNIY